ncbi:hypothetical protein F2Q68_00035637 [Brassica cretica]|uniref:Uncharacterized protein n=1 Tax=Brassica cretica TaxID=69181 RepID=A0A8S9H3H0_BRACR|nr:hypothetical protein F2Q68_00035637 [Brassica cretica]
MKEKRLHAISKAIRLLLGVPTSFRLLLADLATIFYILGNERNEAVDEEQEGIGNVQEEQEEGREDLIEEAEEEDDLWNGHTLPNLYSDELNTEEMFNPINPFVDRKENLVVQEV